MSRELQILTEALREKVYSYDAKKGYKEANKKIYRKLKRDKAGYSAVDFVMKLSDILVMLGDKRKYWKDPSWINTKNTQHANRGLHTTNGESMLWLADQMKKGDEYKHISATISKNGNVSIGDGYHRLAAANHLKLDTMKVNISISSL